MALVVQIVLLLLLLIALIGAIMSIKNWHWAHMLLLLGIVLFGATALLLATETLRTHRALRQGLAGKESSLESLEQQNAALLRGTRDNRVIGELFANEIPYDQEAEGQMPALPVWNQRLQVLSRERGRVWRGVRRASDVDPATGRVQVQIPQPRPHNLSENAIVYAFEAGPPRGDAPAQGAQYLGEFRVVETSPEGAILQSVLALNQRTGQRLQTSNQPWNLYQTMPSDKHELYAGLDEARLRQLLPEQSVAAYLRHGGPPTPDDDEYHRAYFDESGRRVGPEDAQESAAGLEVRYDRPLRDYGYLFDELAREYVMLRADRAALVDDNEKLQRAQELATQLTAYREEEKTKLAADLEKMARDRSVIEAHRDRVLVQLKNGQDLMKQALEYNLELAAMLAERQLAQVRSIDAVAPTF